MTFYNPNCSYIYGVNSINGAQNLMQPTMCANFIYDLNGKKGPNKVGKDIGFMTAFYPADSEIVAPYPLGQLKLDKNKPYSTFTIGNGNASCRKKFGNDAKMANIEELKSVFTNDKLGYVQSGAPNFLHYDTYLSSTITQTSKVYVLGGASGIINSNSISFNSVDYALIFCVKH